MTFNASPPPPRRQEEGIALVVVLLFTAIILTAVVSTTATLALGARGGGASERGAYQALLVAEAGLNTFNARAKALPAPQKYYKNTNSQTDLDQWLTDRGLTSLSVAGGTATLKFEAASTSGGTTTLVVTGTTAAGAKKIIAQDYQSATPPGFSAPAWAPLVSYANVGVSGGAQILGENGNAASGTVQVATLSSAATVPSSAASFTINVASSMVSGALLFSAGDYVRFGTSTTPYKVVARSGAQVTLTPLASTAAPTPVASGTPVYRVDSAVTRPTTQLAGQSGQLRVSDTSMYRVGANVFVKNTSNADVQGTISAIDPILKTLTVQWGTSTTTSSAIAEGTPVRVNVQGVASGYEIGVSGSAIISDGTNQNVAGTSYTQGSQPLQGTNPFNPAANPDLFTSTFGVTKTQVTSLGLVTPIQPSALPSVLSGVTYVNGSVNLSGSNNLCGTGILIVKGDLKFNKTCADGFRGLIYVMGDYDQQGNSTILGAVIVEGAQSATSGTECSPTATPPNPFPATYTSGKGPGNECDTQVAGTGSGGKIVYDRSSLLDAGSLLPDPVFTPVSGTWRQR